MRRLGCYVPPRPRIEEMEAQEDPVHARLSLLVAPRKPVNIFDVLAIPSNRTVICVSLWFERSLVILIAIAQVSYTLISIMM